jgi:hypothetical protein
MHFAISSSHSALYTENFAHITVSPNEIEAALQYKDLDVADQPAEKPMDVEDPTSTNPFEILPTELLRSIFLYFNGRELRACRLTCKSFNDSAKPLLDKITAALSLTHLFKSYCENFLNLQTEVRNISILCAGKHKVDRWLLIRTIHKIVSLKFNCAYLFNNLNTAISEETERQQKVIVFKRQKYDHEDEASSIKNIIGDCIRLEKFCRNLIQEIHVSD